MPGCLDEKIADTDCLLYPDKELSFRVSDKMPVTKAESNSGFRTAIGEANGRGVILNVTSSHMETKPSTKGPLTSIPDEFYVSVVTGEPGEDENEIENVLFSGNEGIYTGGLSWPDSNHSWRFYASNKEMTFSPEGTLVSVSGTDKDIVCAYNGDATYLLQNNLEFTHILSQIGRVIISTDTEAVLEDVSISFTPVTQGTYNIYSGTWSGTTAGDSFELAPSAGAHSTEPHLFFIPGSYAVTVSWRSRINTYYKDRTTTTEVLTFEEGKTYTLSLNLAGISVNFKGQASAPFTVNVLNADETVAKTVQIETGNVQEEFTTVYELYDYDCNGKNATAIDTGICLFDGSFPDGFKIEMEMEITGDNLTKNARSTYITCMSESASPWQGFVWRHNTSADARYEFKVNPSGGSRVATLLESNTLEFTYKPGTARAVINGEEFVANVTIPDHVFPVCIGGSRNKLTSWYSDRYAQFHITYLKIYSLTIPDNDEGAFSAWLPDLEAGQRYSFEGCTQLQKVTQLPATLRNGEGSLENLFKGCGALRSICGFNTEGVTSLRSCFEGCASLLAAPSLVTSSVTDFGRMFTGCSSLSTISSLDTSSGTNFEKMFCNTDITSAPVLDYSKGTNFQYMFEGCRNLHTVPGMTLGSPAADPGYMCGIFRSCSSLENIGTITLPGKMRSTLMADGTIVADDVDFFYYTLRYGGYTTLQYESLKSFEGLSGYDDSLDLSRCPSLTRQSMKSIFNALAIAGSKIPEGDVSATQTRHRITISGKVWHRLLTRDVQIAIGKGWDVYVAGMGSTTVGGVFEGLEIDNYICDGTAATALDTGVRLFGEDLPDGFRLSMDIEVAEEDLKTSAQSTWLSCKAENLSSWPGFSWRHILATASTMELSYRPLFSSSITKPLQTQNHLEIVYDGTSTTVVMNGETYTANGTVPQHNFPLTVGGTYSEIGTWFENRFGKCVVTHLEVYPLGDFDD